MLIGYCRVSTTDQKLDLQKDALLAAGCERIFEDHISGLKKDRQGLNEALSYIRDGDTLVIWKLDRLGRSVKDLIIFVEQLEKRNINFKSLTDQIDTTTPQGRFVFNIMASLAQMERDLIAERTKAGLMAARAKGRIGGRKRLMTESKVEAARSLLLNGTPIKEVANNLGVAVKTLYKWLPASALNTEPNIISLNSTSDHHFNGHQCRYVLENGKAA